MFDVTETEPEMIRMVMLLNVGGYKYGKTVSLPDTTKTWGWFAAGICTFADESDWDDPMEPYDPSDVE